MRRITCSVRTFARFSEGACSVKPNIRTCCSYQDSTKRDTTYRCNKNSATNFWRFRTGFGLALGCSVIGYGVCKYFQLDSGAADSSVRPFAKIPVLSAAKISNPGMGSGDSVSSSSPRNTFNFLADIVEKTAPSVVYVEIKAWHPMYGRLMSISNGSGFIIRSDGLILTNAHVVGNKSKVFVKLHDGQEFEGTVEARDQETDLATVRIKANNLPVLPLGQSSKLRTGEFVIAMGNPLTLSHTITAGVISSVHRPSKELGLHQKTNYIQTDAAINVGNSGGPLVNLDGEAIGINTMKVTEGISFAIPSDTAVEFLKRAEKNSHVKGLKEEHPVKAKKYIGITMLSLTPSLIEELRMRNPNFPQVNHGVLVWRISIESPAYEGGLLPGDVITEINGVKIISASDVYKIIEKDKVLKVKVARDSAIRTFVVTPQEASL